MQAQNLEQTKKENAMPSTNTAIDENGEKLYDIQIELNKLGTAKNNNMCQWVSMGTVLFDSHLM